MNYFKQQRPTVCVCVCVKQFEYTTTMGASVIVGYRLALRIGFPDDRELER